MRLDQHDALDIAVISIDPSRRKSGGALLGDRIRMNAIGPWKHGDETRAKVFMRSLATREAGQEISDALPDVIAACKVAGFDLIVVETSGIGQGDAAIVPLVDVSLYVMTPEFGAASQLEKIDMLDFADFVAINKFDRKGAADALRDVAKQVQRNKELWTTKPDQMPVLRHTGVEVQRRRSHGAVPGTVAEARGVRTRRWSEGLLPKVATRQSTATNIIVPPSRCALPRGDRGHGARVPEAVDRAEPGRARGAAGARPSIAMLASSVNVTGSPQARGRRIHLRRPRERGDPALFDGRIAGITGRGPRSAASMHREQEAPRDVARDAEGLRRRRVRREDPRQGDPHRADHEARCRAPTIRKVALPTYEDHGETLKWLMRENVPGSFPFTAGTFAFKREGEDPTRMFAGEGDPFRTNRRFKHVSEGMTAKRLSTAFDSVTLYGHEPDLRPDIYGKVGNSGVSIATLDDMKVLYSGFDLTSPTTSVSMTINGPAPSILAMFMNTAIDQNLDKFKADNGRDPTDDETQKIRAWVLANVRGTVQADILKEDQGQNTCIFSTEFSLKVMGDIAQWFVQHDVRNFYSVSISGYHIAEAGANPISQLAFTLSNGFTFVEAYLARGMHIDDFAQNLSFFFSNGMDPEYTVMGRVARRIWAVAMRDQYGANERSQKLKYHIQTSGRSLHAQEIQFNDIRTTLQALIAVYDNCNSLHTNAFDEAITTPTEDSVRRAMAIQLIINREWGLAKNENPNQGAFIVDELTDLVEEAVLVEFERIAERGGVLGAMETGYQRGKIQEESMHYEMLKHTGELPIVGVNTFRNPHGDEHLAKVELMRSTEEEKQSQLKRLADFHAAHASESPAMLKTLQQAVIDNGNVFEVLMEAVRVCSLGQITEALFEVGGQYRRSM